MHWDMFESVVQVFWKTFLRDAFKSHLKRLLDVFTIFTEGLGNLIRNV